MSLVEVEEGSHAEPTVTGPRPGRYPLVMGGIVALYVFSALRLVYLGNLNHDEGYYLYTARLVYEGKVPYRDFAFFQAPLLLYVYGLPQALVGGSLYAGRLTSFVLGAATLVLVGALARRLAGKLAALIATALLVATSTFDWVFTTTRTEPLTGCLVALSLYCLLGRKGRWAEAIAVSAIVWASAARISCLPAALLVLGLLVYRNRSSWRWCAGLAALAAGQIGVLLGLPLALAGERMIFDVAGAQIWRYRQFRPGVEVGAAQVVMGTAGSIVDHLTRFYVGTTVSVLAIAAVAVAIYRSEVLKRARREYLVLAAMAAALYLPQLSVTFVGEVYLLASVIVLSVLVGCAVRDLHCRLRGGPGAPLALGLALSAILVQAGTAVNDIEWQDSFRYRALPDLRKVAARVAGFVPEDRQMVAFSTYLAVEAGRRVAPGFETSWFSFFPALPDARAKDLHVINLEGLRRAVDDPATSCVALTDFEVKMLAQAQGKDLPPRRPLTESEIFDVLDELKGRYVLIEVVPKFGQWHDFLYVLKR